MNLVIAALEFTAIIDIGSANPEDRCPVRDIRAVSNIQAIASRNGTSEIGEVRILSPALQLQ